VTATDLVVVGAGVMGAWTALRSRRAGWTTTLIDAFGAGHSRATSGDETRIIRSSHGADTFYTRWSREARVAWQTFGDEVGEAIFIEAGALWFARREDAFEAHSLSTLTSMGIPVQRLEPADVAAMWPQIRTDDLAFAVFEPEAGLLMARNGVAAVVRAFGAAGGRYAALRFPDLADAPITETRVCQYETTPDTQFVIDRHPDLDNVWLVGGGSGHGFKHGPVIGSYVVSRIAGAPAGTDEDRFAIGRERVLKQGLRAGADTPID
jgi:glycine/D-amino acid oxidase-like deaminating enzyme